MKLKGAPRRPLLSAQVKSALLVAVFRQRKNTVKDPPSAGTHVMMLIISCSAPGATRMIDQHFRDPSGIARCSHSRVYFIAAFVPWAAAAQPVGHLLVATRD